MSARAKWLRHAPMAVVLLLLALAALLIDPRGNFPLDDDWNFALATWNFHDTGHFRFARMTGMSLRAQVMWGALWTELFGRSFDVLRLSSLFLAACTSMLLYAFLCGLRCSPRRSAFFSAVLTFSPIFLWSSFNYMTHVPFVFLSLATLAVGVLALRRDSFSLLLAALALMFASCLVRQTGIANAVPLAVGVWLSLARLTNSRRWLAAVGSSVVLFATLYWATTWFSGYPGQIGEHYRVWGGSTLANVSTFLVLAHRYTSFNLEYAALFFLPVSLIAALSLKRSDLLTRDALSRAILVALSLHVVLQLLNGDPFPFHRSGNVIENLAFGPLTLRDTAAWFLPYPRSLLYPVRVVATLLIGSLAALFAIRVFAEVRKAAPAKTEREIVVLMAAAHVVLATAFLFVSGFYFDRYSLDSTWAVLIVAALTFTFTQRLRIAALVALGLTALLSVGGTREYLGWNRARWQAFAFLQRAGVRLDQMDGGYEINQFLRGGWDGRTEGRLPGMSVEDDRYVITFRPLPRYRSLARFPYPGFSTRYVYALERSGEIPVWKLRQSVRSE